jgi:clan AA aspartic protease (TIGR02281 family)
VRKEREAVNSATVKFRREGGVPVVDATLNGQVTEPMVFDSGAALVCLPWKVADALGMRPGPNDPAITLEVANGKKVQARLITVKTVRVAQFVATDVECAVLPQGATGTGLLGGSFLRQFVYRMDLSAGEIHMSQIVTPSSQAIVDAATRPSIPAAVVAEDAGWTVLFRSADPTRWNTSVRRADEYAVPLDKAPRNLRYLRIKHANGDMIIVAMRYEHLGSKIVGDRVGWEGRAYDRHNAIHLGVLDTTLNRAYVNAIDVTQHPGAGFTGYGFGNRVGTGDRQGYAWEGKPIEPTVFEIAVTARELTVEEKRKLLTE